MWPARYPLSCPWIPLLPTQRPTWPVPWCFSACSMGSVTLILALGLRTWITAPIVDENKKLRHEAEDQSNFLTIITHELKTPLSSILAFTELWKERVPDDSPESRVLVNEVETNARVLLAMIDNVLDAAKLEAARSVSPKTSSMCTTWPVR